MKILQFVVILTFISITAAISADNSKIILDTSNAINKKTPITVDSATTLINTAPLTNKLLYRYRINNYEKYKMTHSANKLRKSTINSVCTNPNLKNAFFSQGISLGYYYMDENNRHLFSFDVAPKDCGY